MEARVISMQRDINRLEELQGEPLFLSSRHLWENKKECTKEAICTRICQWDSSFEFYPKPDNTIIVHASRELWGKATAWWHGLRTIRSFVKYLDRL